ncbi:terpene synthase family protein [Nocardia thraciensis]
MNIEYPATRMPYQVRRNCHLRCAEIHAKDWARRMRMIGDQSPQNGDVLWSESEFDAISLPSLTAHLHPDASESDLNLITDWYSWMFAFDDHFMRAFMQSRDTAAAEKFVRRLVHLMPLIPTGEAPKEENSVERGLADLWPQIIRPMSAHWRQRFRRITILFMDGHRYELAHLAEGRVPDLLEYIHLRRNTYSGDTGVCMIERTAREIPENIIRSLPMRILIDAFTDWQGLRNDMVSYNREVHDCGVVDNAISVVQHALNAPLHRAVETVGRLMNDRLDQFERLANRDLPDHLESENTDPREREITLATVKSMQEFLAGVDWWHSRAPRYEKAIRI